MRTTDDKIVRVTPRNRCPVCGKGDWCGVSADGATVFCMRVESDRQAKNGAWIHRLTEPVRYRPTVRPQPKPRPVPVRDCTDLARRYEQMLTNVAAAADSLGVSARSLERLQIGFNGQGHTFPMRDGRERVIGIRVRGRNGRKWCVPGSRNGLFWPEQVYSGSDYRLLICEGPTDCAALLDLGFDAIGRPSCQGGTEHVIEFLKGKRRDVVIVADHDEPKQRPDGSVWYPGQEGAARLAQAIRPLVRTVKIIKPPFHKDMREWYRAGATRAVVETIISNTRYVT